MASTHLSTLDEAGFANWRPGSLPIAHSAGTSFVFREEEFVDSSYIGLLKNFGRSVRNSWYRDPVFKSKEAVLEMRRPQVLQVR